jgi:REP element-mobilizing transposase RayT
VDNVLTKFDGQRYVHHSQVIMPNHVHLLFSLEQGQALEKVIKAWKGVSSREIQRIHECDKSRFWAKDYFDRLIRDEAHFWNVARYIRRNPPKAHLPPKE